MITICSKMTRPCHVNGQSGEHGSWPSTTFIGKHNTVSCGYDGWWQGKLESIVRARRKQLKGFGWQHAWTRFMLSVTPVQWPMSCLPYCMYFVSISLFIISCGVWELRHMTIFSSYNMNSYFPYEWVVAVWLKPQTSDSS